MNLCWIFTVTLILWSSALWAGDEGGSTSGGGGGGIACFNPSRIPNPITDDQGRLTERARGQIVRLEFLDYWLEKDVFTRFRSSPVVNTISPYFAYRLQQAEQLLRSRRQNTRGLPLLNDTGFELIDQTLPAHCKRVQIFLRYSESRPNLRPVVRLQADEDLFQRLDALNQSMANLHEQLYVLGAELGHRDSMHVRWLTAYLHSDLWESLGYRRDDTGYTVNSDRDRLDIFRFSLGAESFGAAANLFWDDVNVTNPIPHSFGSRQRSFSSWLRKRTEALNEILATQQLTPQNIYAHIPEFLAARDRLPLRIVDGLSNEEAFIEIAMQRVFMSGSDAHVENLLIPNPQLSIQRFQYDWMQKICGDVSFYEAVGAPDYRARPGLGGVLETQFSRSERASLRRAVRRIARKAKAYCDEEWQMFFDYPRERANDPARQ